MTTKTRALLVTAALLLSSSPAAAQLGTTEHLDYASPRWYYVEFKLGPYSPDVDAEFPDGSEGPFERIFGSGTAVRLMGEVDVEVWKGFGTVCAGAAAGWYSVSAGAFLDNSAGGGLSTSTERSSSETSLTLVPVSLLAIYRFDWAANEHHVPLVPYVKFGLNYTFWWSEVDGNTSEYTDAEGNTSKASGGTFGLQFNAGAAFRLDVLEPGAAKTLDVELGINHTYLFVEFVTIFASGFGKDTAFNVGDTTFQGGLAFEF